MRVTVKKKTTKITHVNVPPGGGGSRCCCIQKPLWACVKPRFHHIVGSDRISASLCQLKSKKGQTQNEVTGMESEYGKRFIVQKPVLEAPRRRALNVNCIQMNTGKLSNPTSHATPLPSAKGQQTAPVVYCCVVAFLNIKVR